MNTRLSRFSLATVVITLFLFITVPAFAASVFSARCGTRIIKYGTPQSQVLKACGRPTMQAAGRAGTGGSDTWTYNRGPGKFMGVIRFVDGKVSSIEKRGYGFADPNFHED